MRWRSRIGSKLEGDTTDSLRMNDSCAHTIQEEERKDNRGQFVLGGEGQNYKKPQGRSLCPPVVVVVVVGVT